MKITEHIKPELQWSQIGCHRWRVHRLFELSKNLPVVELPIDAISVFKKYDVTMREMVGHMKAVINADMSYPIIMDEDGEIMDGRHRIMRAIMDGHKTIKAVRFDENPDPCKIDEADNG